jgi:phosphatidylserine/phosphatidylglycerophosphate/cardiolipin synthase-like enzyme
MSTVKRPRGAGRPAGQQLVVLPDDGMTPLLAAIRGARESILVKMFLFTEPRLMRALGDARRRGVKVRVMLNPSRRSGESDNDGAMRRLRADGITVKDTDPAFDVSHEKSMVVDGAFAFVKSHNWAPKNFGETRDYAVITRDPEDVAEVCEGFEADWRRAEFVCDERRLIWCRGNGRERLARFVDRARDYLYLQNERYQDPTIIERLVAAHARGVRVHVMSLPPHALKEKKLLEGVAGLRVMADTGIKVHKLKGLHLHAKMLLADGERAIVGSMNIAPGSFDSRRELAIETEDPAVVKRLERIFRRDWKNSHRIDLSDEGIRADLEKHGVTAESSVSVIAPSEKTRKPKK